MNLSHDIGYTEDGVRIERIIDRDCHTVTYIIGSGSHREVRTITILSTAPIFLSKDNVYP